MNAIRPEQTQVAVIVSVSPEAVRESPRGCEMGEVD